MALRMRQPNPRRASAEDQRGFAAGPRPTAGCGRSPTAWAAMTPARSPAPWSPMRCAACRSSTDLDELADSAVEALRPGQSRADRARPRRSDAPAHHRQTVVGLAIADGDFRCFWVGDSRAYRLRDGEIVQLSPRPQPGPGPGRRRHAHARGSRNPRERQPHHPRGRRRRRPRGRIVSGDARPGDMFLLASDGLTRVVGDDELAAELARHRRTRPPTG